MKKILSISLFLLFVFVKTSFSQTIPDNYYYSDNLSTPSAMTGDRFQNGYMEILLQNLCEKSAYMYVMVYAIDDQGEYVPLIYAEDNNAVTYSSLHKSMNLPTALLYAPLVYEWYIHYSDGTSEMKINVL